MISDNEQKLEEIFRIVLELEADCDVSTVRRLAEFRWDSLAHVSIVAAVESEFGVNLDGAEMDRMSSYAATRMLLDEKGL